MEILENVSTKEFFPPAVVEPIERLPIALEKATESGKKFERQMKNTGETVQRTSRYYNNIFKQLNEWDKKHGVTDSRNLKNWSLWGGFATAGDTIANTTKSLKTFDNTVLTTANDIITSKNVDICYYHYTDTKGIKHVYYVN